MSISNLASGDAPRLSIPRAVDLIVPVYRNPTLVKACVDSVLTNMGEVQQLSPRVVLVDDSPDDVETSELLKSYLAGPHRDQVLLLVNEKNLGFVGAVNRGLSQAHSAGRDVVLINSDTVTFKGTLSKLFEAVREDPQIGFASPRSNNASICSLPHFHGGTLSTPEQAFQRWAEISRTLPAWHFVPTAVGFYLYISHSILANHGGLRSDFGAGYEEENDLIMRAGKVGTRAVMVNHSFAYHAGSASFSLTNIDLVQHRHNNHQMMVEAHPEFLPLVRRYEGSAHFRAERLMSGMLPDDEDRLRIVFDLTGLGQHHNGTNEHAVAVVKHLAVKWAHRMRVAGIGTPQSFRFHGLDKVSNLHREDPQAPGIHAVAIRIAQPFDLHQVNVMENLAPVNLYAMLDTISEDCGPLSVDGTFLELWDYVAQHANGLLFNSRFAERQFCIRHPEAAHLPRMAKLLSTQPGEYKKAAGVRPARRHVLVLGNHFAHKASDPAGRRLAAAFPNLQIVVLGSSTFQQGNVIGFRSGTLEQAKMDELFLEASVVVLPSHLEGFGFGLMHALASSKPVAARRIGATEEILSVLVGVHGVALFDSDLELPQAVGRALQWETSGMESSAGPSWADWGDAVAEFSLKAVNQEDVFVRLRNRIQAGDQLRLASVIRAAPSPAATIAARTEPVRIMPAVALPELLDKNGRDFVEHAYGLLLRRAADDSGLAFYLAQLASGVEKREVVRALASSAEARAHAVQVEGLPALLASAKRARRSGLKRLLGR